METARKPRVVVAERFRDDAIITFEDGQSAVYPASLLWKVFFEAREIPKEDEED
jgi:hypothetical protein